MVVWGSTLASELKQRGLGIAESCRGYLLTQNVPQLTSLTFDARLGARRELVGYAFILDKQGQILSPALSGGAIEKGL